MSPLTASPESGRLEQAVARATVPAPSVSPAYVKEWVRFTWHGLSITLCGICALVIPTIIALPLLLFFVGLFAWYELLRDRTWLQPYVSRWPLLLYRKWRSLARPQNGDEPLPTAASLTTGAGFFLLTLIGLPLYIFSCWHPMVARSIKVRPHEIGTRASSLDYLVGFTIAWSISPIYALATACFVTAWCDPLARVIGKQWGRYKWSFSNKTREGSLACAIVAVAVAAVSLNWLSDMTTAQIVATSFATGIVAAGVELLPQFPRQPRPGDILSPADNFSIILATSAVLTLLHHMFNQGVPPI